MRRFYDILDFTLFEGVNKYGITEILKNSSYKISSYKKGDIAVFQDSLCKSLLLLCQGTLLAKMTNAEGKEITIEYLAAPEILAPAFVYSSENRFPVTLQAEDDVIICSLHKEKFLRMMETDDVLLRNFLRQISDRSVFLSQKLNEFALQNLSTRVISYLQKNSVISNIQDVAFIMGVARPSLSRILSSMVEDGTLIKTEEGYRLS